MLFSEFIDGTGCKDNEYNYKIYKRLELMYMADDSITKAEIYEYGKKLVDNSKTAKELEIEANWKAELKELNRQLDNHKAQIKQYTEYYKMDKDVYWKQQAQWQRQLAKTVRNQIAGLKWCLATV